MSPRALAVAALASVVLAACGRDPPPKPPAICNPPPEAEVPVVALSSSDVCPRAGAGKDGRWEVAPLFPSEAGERLPASMRRLCVYTWSGCGPRETAALPLEALVFAADDPPLVQPLAAATRARAELVATARGRLVRAADGLVPMLAASSATPVFLGFPDSSPAAPGNPDDITIEAASHGFDVAWVARFLTCPGGALRPCLGRVRTDLALGRSGARGARADLAASLVRLVRAWKTRDGRAAPLVLPIAAGWEPAAERVLPWLKGPPPAGSATPAKATVDPDALPAPAALEGGAGAALTPGGRAVLAALHHAACHGALVIAASGNDPGYREPPSGAMYPAAWETLPAPSIEACKAWFGEDAVRKLATPTVVHAPLVHAVGGVDDRDHAIIGTRAKSLPRLVAPASLVAAFPDDPVDAGYARSCAPGADISGPFVCDRTTPRTGTSMAAAVTASIAAVVWAHHPTWSGHDVMGALYTGGVSLGEKADVSLSGPGKDTVVRVSLCGALAASCKGAAKGACPERLKCLKPPAFARGPRPSPFVPLRPGIIPLALDTAGAGGDPIIACPTCVFHTGRFRNDGCELEGLLPAAFFAGTRAARVEQPGLDLYDASGRRLGFIDSPGFRPQLWSASEPGEQPIYADAASCSGAVQVVLRWAVCADEACKKVLPMASELPIVE